MRAAFSQKSFQKHIDLARTRPLYPSSSRPGGTNSAAGPKIALSGVSFIARGLSVIAPDWRIPVRLDVAELEGLKTTDIACEEKVDALA